MMRRPLRFARRWLIVAGLALLASCGSPSSPSPPPPPVDSLKLTCPSNIAVEDVKVASLPISYMAPVASGGVPPISTACSPVSGSNFPLGTTNVSCNATDGVRSATCAFAVTLVPFVPLLDGTNFLAVGDSITAGENGIEGPDIPCAMARTSGQRPLFIEACRSYPSVLLGLLVDRYKKQTPVVINAGERGETTEGGRSRLPGLLTGYRPDMLLLLEGVNDLLGRPADVIPNLRDMIQIARRNGVKRVFLSTLIPMKPGFRADAMALVAPMNMQIRALAIQQNVILVDNEAAFLAKGDYYSLLSDDGEHPSPEGYQVIAGTFFDAIRSTSERPSIDVAAVREKAVGHR